ncbi:MAG: hypothetical protein CMH83_02760 [Nocardioides sp.]|nr:hypothetical protein [Nocardioides sp.]
MRRPTLPRISSGRLALVVSTLALLVVTGAPSEAAKLINGKNLKNNSVTGKKIKNGSLTGADLKNNSVSGGDLKNGSVSGADLKNGSVSGADVKDGSLTGADLAADSVSGAQVDESSLQGLLGDGDVAVFGSSDLGEVNDFTANSFTSVLELSMTAPSDGFVLVTGSISAEDDTSLVGPGWLNYRVSLDGASPSFEYNHELAYEEMSPSGGAVAASGAVSFVFPVSAGAHTFDLEAMEVGAGSYLFGRTLTAIFTPSGDVTVLRPAARSPQGQQR